MPSGGARARSGPAPDPQALRRSREGEWLTLPAEGRSGDPPDWPLSGPMHARETALWYTLWKKPQAAAWEKFGLEHEVALYVRRLAEAEKPGSPANISTLCRQIADSIGLTIPGMRANRWKIADDEIAEARADRPAKQFTSARDRLKVAGE